MTAINQDMTIYAGDHIIVEILVTKVDGSVVVPVNISARYSIARNNRSASLLTKSSDDDEIIFDEEDGTMLAKVELEPDDTKDLRSGYYYHELEIKDTNFDNKYYTVMTGKVEVKSTIIKQQST